MVKNLTVGKPLKLIINLFIPLMIGNVIQQLYCLLSSIFVGRYVGVEALAGVGSASNLLFLIFGFVQGICNGCSIVLAQRFGARSRVGVRLCLTHSIYLCAIIAVIITAISIIVTKPILELTNTPVEIFKHAHTFAFISFCGIFTQMAFNLFAAILRGLGDNKSSLYLLIFAAILNISFDYITVAFLKLGIVGAACSTIAAQFISSVLCCILIFKKYRFMRPQRQNWKINRLYIFSIIKISLPMAVECSVTSIGLLILQHAINNFGATTVAGFTIAMKIENILIATFLALACATSAFVAQNYGAENYARIKKGARVSFFSGISACAFFTVLLLMFWDVFVELFINSDSIAATNITLVKQAARQYLDIAILNYPALCTLIVFSYIVPSIGQPIIPIFSGLLELAARAFITLFIAKIFSFGYSGICSASVLAWYAALTLNVSAYFYIVKKLMKTKKAV